MTKIDLSFTTVKQELPDFIYQQLGPYAGRSNSYHHQPDELRSLIAKKHDVALDSVALTAGSDQAIMLLSSLHGRRGHIFTPTYIAYSDIKRFGGLTEHQALQGDDYAISTDTIPDATLIFLANPNNPAGITERQTILELVRNNPDALVVVDEAYGDFAGESVVSDVADYANLVVLRSFSKGYSLAGFRIGYMVAQPSVLENLVLESTWFNVAYTSVGAAISALQHEGYFAEIRNGIIADKAKLEAVLQEASYTVIPGHINAVLVRFDDRPAAQRFVDMLAGKDIIVSHGNGGSNVGLDMTFVRISIGTPEQMTLVREVIKSGS
jgi:histidinol-phosphate aminotransferase